jgi:hypothetical protein
VRNCKSFRGCERKKEKHIYFEQNRASN